MLVVVNKQDQTLNIPHDSIQIESVQGDPLGKAKFQVIDNNSSISLQGLQEVIIFDENVALGGTKLIPAHNYLTNNNFNYGNTGWTESGTLTGRITFPSNPTFGAGAKATLTFSNQAVGSDKRTQTLGHGISPQNYVIVGQQYCLSMTINVTAGFVNSYAFFQIVFLDASGSALSTTSSSNIFTAGSNRLSVTATAPANTISIQAVIGGTTTSTTNSGTATFTALQLEPVWFPNLYNYPTPICDFLQADSCPLLIDNTVSRFDRVMSGFITHLTATYEGPVRTWDVEVTAGDWMLELGKLTNISYTNTTDATIIIAMILGESTPLWASDATLQSGTPQALSYQNVPICYTGATVPTIQYADATNREILNSLQNITGFTYGVDPYYNVYYYPPFYTQCPYTFSSSPDNVNSFPYYDYSIEHDYTQLHNIENVLGTTFSTTVTESWTFQDGSHTETVQAGKTVNVYLKHIPAELPQSVTVGGAGISCGQDTGTGYGTAQSIITVGTSQFGTSKLLSFPAPGYAAGVAISVVYAYDTLAYTNVQSPDSIAQYGQLFASINDSSLTSLNSCAIRGEAELEEYSQSRDTLKFKVNQLAGVGQVITFTSALDNITSGHYTVQKVTARYLGNRTNEYEIEAGTYVDNFVDFFRNTQKTASTVSHDPAETIKQTNLLQQDNISLSDSLFIHT